MVDKRLASNLRRVRILMGCVREGPVHVHSLYAIQNGFWVSLCICSWSFRVSNNIIRMYVQALWPTLVCSRVNHSNHKSYKRSQTWFHQQFGILFENIEIFFGIIHRQARCINHYLPPLACLWGMWCDHGCPDDDYSCWFILDRYALNRN